MRFTFAYSIVCALIILSVPSFVFGNLGTTSIMLIQNSHGTPQVLRYAKAAEGPPSQPVLSISTLNSSSFEDSRNLEGSIQTFPTIMQAFRSQLNFTLADATTAALNAVGRDSLAVSSSLLSEDGFLVYNIILLDAGNEIHRVIIDAGNGDILADSTVSPDQLSLPSTSPGWPAMMPSPPVPPPPPHGGGFVLPVPPPLTPK